MPKCAQLLINTVTGQVNFQVSGAYQITSFGTAKEDQRACWGITKMGSQLRGPFGAASR